MSRYSSQLPAYVAQAVGPFATPISASLLGVTGSALSRFENGSRRPSAELIVGADVIFGHSAKDVFPAFHHTIERSIVSHARAMHKKLKSKTDNTSREKLRLFTEIIDRASQAKLDI